MGKTKDLNNNQKEGVDSNSNKVLNPTQYFHKEFENNIEDKIYHFAEGNPILRYVTYKDAKYRVVHYIEPLYAKEKLSKLNKTIYNRQNAKIHHQFRNDCLNEVRENLIGLPKIGGPGLAFSKHLKETGKTITDLDIKYLSEYIASPDSFIKKNRSCCTIKDINKVYSKYLSKLIEDKAKTSEFFKLKTSDAKIEFLKINITEANYTRIINSNAHSELIIKKSFSSNARVDAFSKFSKKGLGTALGTVLFVYDYSNYDNINLNQHPVKELVENTAIGFGISTAVPYVLTGVGLTISSPAILMGVIFVTSAIATSILVAELDEFIKENDIGGITTESNKNLKNEIMNSKYKSKVYVVIFQFFENYLKIIDNCNKYLTDLIKKEKKRKDIINKLESEKLFTPKPIISDRLRTEYFELKPKLVQCDYPLNELVNVELANKVIDNYIINLEETAKQRVQFPDDYYQQANRNWIKEHSETTQMFNLKNKIIKAEEEKIKAEHEKIKAEQEAKFDKNFKDLLNNDLNQFYLYLNSWNFETDCFIRSEFTETRLFQFIEPYF